MRRYKLMLVDDQSELLDQWYVCVDPAAQGDDEMVLPRAGHFLLSEITHQCVQADRHAKKKALEGGAK